MMMRRRICGWSGPADTTVGCHNRYIIYFYLPSITDHVTQLHNLKISKNDSPPNDFNECHNIRINRPGHAMHRVFGGDLDTIQGKKASL